MKTFGELTFKDKIYRVIKNGVAVQFNIYSIQDYYYKNKVVFGFSDSINKTPQLLKSEAIVEDEISYWFANAEDAKTYLEELLESANEVVHNCLTSKFEVFK